MNGPDAMFETFRIAHWVDTPRQIVRQAVALGFYFRDRSLFHTYSNYMSVAGNLLQHMAHTQLTAGSSPLLTIQPLVLKNEGVMPGWGADIFLDAFGDNEHEARLHLAETLRTLTPFLCTGRAGLYT